MVVGLGTWVFSSCRVYTLYKQHSIAQTDTHCSRAKWTTYNARRDLLSTKYFLIVQSWLFTGVKIVDNVHTYQQSDQLRVQYPNPIHKWQNNLRIDWLPVAGVLMLSMTDSMLLPLAVIDKFRLVVLHFRPLSTPFWKVSIRLHQCESNCCVWRRFKCLAITFLLYNFAYEFVLEYDVASGGNLFNHPLNLYERKRHSIT